MSNVVKFLEMLGNQFQPMDVAQMQVRMDELQLDADVQRAVWAGDVARLALLAKAPPTVFCALLPSENEEPQEESEQPEDDDSASIRRAAA